MKDKFIGFRASEDTVNKLNELTKLTKRDKSKIISAMIEHYLPDLLEKAKRKVEEDAKVEVAE